MGFSKRGLAVFVLFCCYTSSLAEDGRKELLKVSIEPNEDNKEIVQGTLFSTDHSSFPFAICEWTKPGIEKTCEIKLIDKPREDRVCTGIRVFTDLPDRELFLNGYFQVIPFTQDHVVLAWWDRTKENSPQQKKNFKVSIVNMLSCQETHLDYPIDEVVYGRLPSLLLFPNRVDVILNSKASCDGAAQCRLSYGLDGKQIGGVFPYNQELLGYSNPVSQSAPSKGFFVSVQDLKTLRVLLVQMNGEGQLLSTDTYEPNDVKQRVSFNSAHEKYTICRMPDTNLKRPTNIHCNQYDDKGKETIKKTITFQDIANWMAVRSLAEGGFLVASAGCDIVKSTADCPNFRVWKVEANGHVGKPRKIEGPNVSCNDMSTDLQVRITEDNRDRFCFDFACTSNHVALTYVRKCIPKSDLV